MGQKREQRAQQRSPITLTLRWTGPGRVAEAAETGDLSASGCFILSNARPEIGTILWLSLTLTKTTWLHLRAEVICLLEVGFGVRFVDVTMEVQAALTRLIADYYAAMTDSPEPEQVWAAELTARLEAVARWTHER